MMNPDDRLGYMLVVRIRLVVKFKPSLLVQGSRTDGWCVSVLGRTERYLSGASLLESFDYFSGGRPGVGFL